MLWRHIFGEVDVRRWRVAGCWVCRRLCCRAAAAGGEPAAGGGGRRLKAVATKQQRSHRSGVDQFQLGGDEQQKDRGDLERLSPALSDQQHICTEQHQNVIVWRADKCVHDQSSSAARSDSTTHAAALKSNLSRSHGYNVTQNSVTRKNTTKKNEKLNAHEGSIASD